MTFERSGRSDAHDARRGNVLVAELQEQLVLAVDPEVMFAHLETMFLELDFQAPDTRSETDHANRAFKARFCTLVAVATMSVTGSFAVAGALPGPAQHWLAAATRVVGIHLPDPAAEPETVPAHGASGVQAPPAAETASPVISVDARAITSAARARAQAPAITTPRAATPRTTAPHSGPGAAPAPPIVQEPVPVKNKPVDGGANGPPVHGPVTPPSPPTPGNGGGHGPTTPPSPPPGNGSGTGKGTGNGNGNGGEHGPATPPSPPAAGKGDPGSKVTGGVKSASTHSAHPRGDVTRARGQAGGGRSGDAHVANTPEQPKETVPVTSPATTAHEPRTSSRRSR